MMFHSELISWRQHVTPTSLSDRNSVLYFPSAVHIPFSFNKFFLAAAWLQDRLRGGWESLERAQTSSDSAQSFRDTHCHISSITITRDKDPSLISQVLHLKHSPFTEVPEGQGGQNSLAQGCEVLFGSMQRCSACPIWEQWGRSGRDSAIQAQTELLQKVPTCPSQYKYSLLHLPSAVEVVPWRTRSPFIPQCHHCLLVGQRGCPVACPERR